MSSVTLTEDAENGRVATFSLSTVLDLVEHNNTATAEARPLSTVKDFAEVTLTFTLASKTMNHTDEVGTYQILGGTELKVDIHIDVLTPVDGIDFLTIEQALRDDRGTYRPEPDEANGAGGEPATDELRRYRDQSELKQVIEFRQRDDIPGFYSWVKKAEVTKADGAQEVVDVRAAYIISEDRMVLYLSYPYDVNTTYIFHDPSLGVFEGGIIDLIPEEWRAIFDPLLFGIAAVAAVAVVYGMRARPRRPEDDDLEWEDDEPMEVAAQMDKGKPPNMSDGIEDLPDEPRTNNGSMLLINPPPDVPIQPPKQGDGWTEWDE
jgi:hypothetical protein